MTSTRSHRSRRVLAAVTCGVLVFAGCTSEPSEKRVALDVIESMGVDHKGGTLTDTQQECMIDAVEGYTDEQLAAIGEANLELDRAGADFADEGTKEMQTFFADLQSCMTGEPSETPTTTAPSGETGDTTATTSATTAATTSAGEG